MGVMGEESRSEYQRYYIRGSYVSYISYTYQYRRSRKALTAQTPGFPSLFEKHGGAKGITKVPGEVL